MHASSKQTSGIAWKRKKNKPNAVTTAQLKMTSQLERKANKMKKLTYINEDQIINDAAQTLIERHLNWSNSLDSKPSSDSGHVYGMMMDAILDAKYTYDEWCALTKSEQVHQECEVRTMFEKAAKIADRKWEAAMVLLGIEN